MHTRSASLKAIRLRQKLPIISIPLAYFPTSSGNALHCGTYDAAKSRNPDYSVTVCVCVSLCVFVFRVCVAD